MSGSTETVPEAPTVTVRSGRFSCAEVGTAVPIQVKAAINMATIARAVQLIRGVNLSPMHVSKLGRICGQTAATPAFHGPAGV